MPVLKIKLSRSFALKIMCLKDTSCNKSCYLLTQFRFKVIICFMKGKRLKLIKLCRASYYFWWFLECNILDFSLNKDYLTKI